MHRAALIVHGGAGAVDATRLPACRAGVARAAEAGWAVLDAGGAALDAVVAAVRALEDDPEFNAGHGAVLNRECEIEVDAAVMDGALRIGAVGAVPWLRHPVDVARKILDEGEHALLVGQGALEFAALHGIRPESPSTMVTARARERLEKERAGRARPSATGDTVGAVAVDASGRVAAATSTGGISFKRRGRVGDSPIVGAGTYAEDGLGAASATGHGESILRALMAHRAVLALAGGADATAASAHAVEELHRRAGTAGQGGIILVDAQGRVGHARNTASMPWASVVDGTRDGGV